MVWALKVMVHRLLWRLSLSMISLRSSYIGNVTSWVRFGSFHFNDDYRRWNESIGVCLLLGCCSNDWVVFLFFFFVWNIIIIFLFYWMLSLKNWIQSFSEFWWLVQLQWMGGPCPDFQKITKNSFIILKILNNSS